MRFSIIVPIYNVEKYLGRCVDSLLAQDFQDYELILVDDGSPDSCPELCDGYAESNARVRVIHKENGGLSDARNAGIKQAVGEYLIFVDSDDYWDDTSALAKLSKMIDEYHTDIVQYGHKRYLQIDDSFAHLEKRTLSHLNDLDTAQIYNELIRTDRFSISACLMTTSRSFLVDNNLFFKKGIKSEDVEWALRVFALMPSISLLDENFYVYRMQREGSITSTVDYKHLCDYCGLIEDSVAVIEGAPEQIRDALMSYLMYHVLIAIAFCYKVTLGKKQRKDLLGRLKAVSKGRINKYTLNRKVRLASRVERLCGFAVMARVLGFYLNNRGR